MAAYSQIYSGLSRAQLSFEFLHTNSTSHEFLFGALAEILDNSSDAMAKKLDVYTVPDKNLRGGLMLNFLDDGEGMDRREISNVITFGLSAKKALDANQIGQYGNGLKSASMRIANDLLVFTKKDTTMTCLMLSRTFHEREKIKEVIVPLPSFNVHTKTPLYDNGRKGKDRHDKEMDLILKYSPFKTEKEFFQQFDLISSSGTLVILYNLKLLDSGVTELDFESNPTDILIAGLDMTTDDSLVPEMCSFRAYTSLLYLEPRMKIYIQKKKVQTCRLVYSLCKQRSYSYTSGRFKTRSTNEAKKAEQELKSAKERLKDADGQGREMERSMSSSATKDQRVKLRQLQVQAEDLRTEVSQKQIIFDKKQKALRDPKTLTFIFGLNLDNRNRDGGFIYNCNRLIKMYTKVGPQLEGGMMCKGVVCIVNVPYQVLEPTCSKQDFADAKEYRHLTKTMGEHMEQYWRDSRMADNNFINKFWGDFGYLTSSPSEKASEDPTYVNRRARETKICLQCDKCLKWRVLPFSSSNIGKAFPDDWTCAMNPDRTRNKCSATEEKLNLPEGKFQKVEKSEIQKQSEIEDKIRKLQQQKTAISSESQVRSSREAKEKMAEMASRKAMMEDLRSRRSSSEEVSPEACSSTPQRKAAENAKRAIKDQDERRTMPQFNKRRRMSHFRNAENTDEETSEDGPQVDVTYNPSPSSGPGSRRSRKATGGVNGAKPQDRRTSTQSNTSGGSNEEWWPELSDDEGQEQPTRIEVGTRVEVKVRGKWCIGSAIKKLGSDFIIRLDKWPNEKYDRRIPPNYPDIRLAAIPASPPAEPEMPSSSTACTISLDAEEQTDMSEKLKTCIHYFMPPNFPIPKDDIHNLTTEQLRNFDFPNFFDCYEKGLRELISGFELETERKTREAELLKREIEMYKQQAMEAKESHQHTNGLIARLLNSIHDECNLDPDADSDKVNELLQACVLQAEMPTNQDQVTTSTN